jgi:hypothetical protein
MKNTDNIEERLYKLEEKIDALMIAISGNPLTKDGGIVDRLIKLEQFVESFNKKKIYYIGYASATIFMIGFLVAMIKASVWLIGLLQKW